jgi:flagellar biosynthesis chaperone FliJ
MQDIWKLRKKVYGSLESIKRFQMNVLQSEAVKMADAVRNMENELKEKEMKMNDVSLQVKASVGGGKSLDPTIFDSRLKYYERLQEEMFHHQIVKKNLDKKHEKQIYLVNEKYKQSKLYEKIVSNNNVEINKNRIKEEQKGLDELCSSRDFFLSEKY